MLTDTFLSRLAALRPCIGVAGDSMIDAYRQVDITRISPEFPVPVMRTRPQDRATLLPGGAANVCHQLRHFPVEHRLFSYFDHDLATVLRDNGIRFGGTSYHLPLVLGGVPVKRRFYAGDIPFCRWDEEDDRVNTHGITQFMEKVDWEKNQPDVLILSDYNKGFFDLTNRPALWLKRSPITIIDPKKQPISRWRGCTIFKPNAVEAREMSGYHDWVEQCRYFLMELKCQHVVITNGRDGVCGMSQDGTSFIINRSETRARSVVGAGDCFAAFLGMAAACDFSIAECADLAFRAAQCYVSNLHNRPITPRQLVASEDPVRAKFLPPQPADREGTLVFTNGCFDILHPGHLATLRFAKQQGSRLVVAVNSDASVRRLKGEGRPFLPLADRMEVLANLECVDYVVAFTEDTPELTIRLLQPDVVVKGGDYRAEDVVGHGIVPRVVIAPLVPNQSTTGIASRFTCSPE